MYLLGERTSLPGKVRTRGVDGRCCLLLSGVDEDWRDIERLVAVAAVPLRGRPGERESLPGLIPILS
jgi:hypothetical protein